MIIPRIVSLPRAWALGLLGVVTLVLLACGAETDVVAPVVPASTTVPTRPPEVTLANQDAFLRRCIESEMRRGSTSLSDGIDALSNLVTIRDPGDPYRLGLIVQCSELGYLEEVSEERSAQASASVTPTRMPTPKATRTQASASVTPTRMPTPKATRTLAPASVTPTANSESNPDAGSRLGYTSQMAPPAGRADLRSGRAGTLRRRDRRLLA